MTTTLDGSVDGVSPDETDVIVIGAGFAGVTAARELTRQGRTVRVIEARDRIGGRTWTDHRLDHDLELGGTWVHWYQPHVWAELNRYGIGVFETLFPAEMTWVVDGVRHTGTIAEYRAELGRGLDSAIRRSREAFPLPYRPDTLDPAELAELDAVTVPEVLAADPELTDVQRRLGDMMWGLHFNTTGEGGAFSQALRWGALSGGDWLLLQEICTRFQIDGGTKGLIESIWSDAEAHLHLQTMVDSVVQDDDGVTVTTTAGHRFRAGRVLSTVPIGALGRVRFEPPLPAEASQVIAQGQASRGVKVFVRAAGARPAYGVVSADPGGLSSVRYLYDDGDSHVLVCFGPDAAAIDLADRASVQKAFEALVPGAEVLDWTGHDWTADSASGQTWAMLRPGQLALMAALQQPHGRVLLCGSDYARGWSGLIDGAIESGTTGARWAASPAATPTA